MTDKKTIATPPEAEKKIDPQYDISELLASFSEPKAVERSKAEELRLGMIDDIDLSAARLASMIVNYSDQTTDVEALAGALKSLQTVKYRAKRAIGGVPDEVLDPPADDSNVGSAEFAEIA